MSTTMIGQLVGRIAIERAVQTESEGAGSRPRTDYRPVGTVLQNDGRWHHWMAPGETYRFRHDGTGWHVTCRTWPDWGHIYRLATERGVLVDTIPTTNGPRTLNPKRAYELTCSPAGEADLYEFPG